MMFFIDNFNYKYVSLKQINILEWASYHTSQSTDNFDMWAC